MMGCSNKEKQNVFHLQESEIKNLRGREHKEALELRRCKCLTHKPLGSNPSRTSVKFSIPFLQHSYVPF